jgi:hypothetical protein
MHVQTDIPLASDEGFPRMNADTNANRSVAQTAGDLLGSRNCVRGSRERSKERVALRIHLDARVPRQACAYDATMGVEEIDVPVTVLVKQPGRACDVGEQKRDSSGREILSHAESIFPPR